MKILLTGVETENKGAELMLYAILQEIERTAPNAIVYLPKSRIKQGLGYVKTDVNLKYWPFYDLSLKLHLFKIFKKLHLPFGLLPHMVAARNADYYFDASGFLLSDQFNISGMMTWIYENQYSFLKKKKCKIIFLPQAFGPFKKSNTKSVLSSISKNATLVVPREKVSLHYIEESGIVDMNKVNMFTDFTSLVDGVLPPKYEHLRNGLCVIPNRQMIKKRAITKEDYIELLKVIISIGKETNHVVYLLNHEGVLDEKMCISLNEALPEKVEQVSGLNALEVKGLISTAYLVVSSRFHGVASALNNCVPCLATSWSHKYQELFSDYHQYDCVLPLNNREEALAKVEEYLNEEKNKNVRLELASRVPQIKEETKKMWETVWSTCVSGKSSGRII